MTTSHDEDELRSLAVSALKKAGVADADVFLRSQRRGFARFGRSELDQHMDLDEPLAVVRVAKGMRVAEVRSEELAEDAIVAMLHGAEELAALAPEDPDFPGFARADEPAFPDVVRCEAATSEVDADGRTELVWPVLVAIRKAGLYAAGGLETKTTVDCVATTNGAARTHRATVATFRVWATETAGAGGSSGFGGAMHRDVRKLDLEGETARAIRHAELGKNPIALDVGAYDVVFEPPAIAELVEWLAMTTFGAKDVDQGTSLVAGRLGERVCGTSFTLDEDPTATGDLGFGAPFDREGTTRKKVRLVDAGVARGVLTDRAWAKRRGTASTGNAAPPGAFGGGPMASSLVMAGGDAPSTEALLAGVERGIYVVKLHYVNGMLDTRRAVMTGLTRDGAFLVENGKLVRGIRPLRFTDSFAEATERMDAATTARSAVPTWWTGDGSIVCPAVRIRRFAFTGSG